MSTGARHAGLWRQHLRLFHRIEDDAKQNLERCVQEAASAGASNKSRTALERAKSGILEALKEIEPLIYKGEIWPSLPLRLAHDDATLPWPDRLMEARQRFGFMGLSGNPITWDHIHLALRAISRFRLHCVIVQVIGDHPHKEAKAPKRHRHAIARLALDEFFPLLRYTSLGWGNLKVGEENAAEVALLNIDLPVDLLYVGAGDVVKFVREQIGACRVPLEFLKQELVKKGGRNPDSLPNLKAAILESSPSASSGFIEEKPYDFEATGIRATHFREQPFAPLLPWAAFNYIHENGLYLCSDEELENRMNDS